MIIYFRLKYGLANSIKTYLKLKIHVEGDEMFNLECVLIEFQFLTIK